MGLSMLSIENGFYNYFFQIHYTMFLKSSLAWIVICSVCPLFNVYKNDRIAMNFKYIINIKHCMSFTAKNDIM